MSGAGTPLESPAAADGPLLSSATSALQELVFSVSTARSDMADQTAAAQAEITAQLQGTREAASNAFRDATEIANFFEKECHALQEQITAETSRRVATEGIRSRLATESDALKNELQKCRDELEGSRQREASVAAQLEDAREELGRLRLGNGQDSAQLPDPSDGLKETSAALQLAQAENERLKKQIEQLDDRVEKEVQARTEVEALARAQDEELAHCTASTTHARMEVEKMQVCQRAADEQRSEALAEVQRLRREMEVQKAQHTEALEAERGIHERERASLRGLASPPIRSDSSVDDIAHSVEYELQKLRTEHEEQLASVKRDAETLRQELERKNNAVLHMHTAVEHMQKEHDSFRERTHRDSRSSEEVADLTRENEKLKQQLELSHKQLQLEMQSSPEQSHGAKILQLENDLNRERDMSDKLQRELQAAQHNHQASLESTRRELDLRHTAELEALDMKIRACQDDASTLVEEKAHLNQTVEALNQKLLQVEAERAGLATERDSLQTRHTEQVQELVAKLKLIQEEAGVLAAEKGSLERHAAEVDQALREKEQTMVAERHELERKEESLRAETELQVTAWKIKYDELQQAHQELEACLQTTQEELRLETDTRERIASELDETRGQHANLHDEHQAVLQQRDKSMADHAEVAAAHTEAAAARDASRAQYTELSAKHKSATDEVTTLRAHLQAKEKELDTARQKAADEHQAYQQARTQDENEVKVLQEALRVGQMSLQTVQDELDDQKEHNKRMHEDNQRLNEERDTLAKEHHEEKAAHYKTKERAAVELAESKHAFEREVSQTKAEAMQRLAEANAASEEGYAALQKEFDAQVAEVEALKEDHTKIQTRWEEDRIMLESEHEQSMVRYTEALELAEQSDLEAQNKAAQHSSLFRDHTEASEEVEKLRRTVEALSKELTEAHGAHASAAAELDVHRARHTELSAEHKTQLTELSVEHKTQLERAMDEAQDEKDKALAMHRKQSDEATAKLRTEYEEAISGLRADHAATSAEHSAEQQRSQELAATLQACQAQVTEHEETKTQLCAQLDEHRLQKLQLESQLAAAEDTHLAELQVSKIAAEQELQQMSSEFTQAHAEVKVETERLQAALSEAEANLVRAQAESEAERRSSMDQVTESLAIAHANLKKLEEERAEQTQVMEMKEQELNEWRGRALGGENALLRSASHALALSEEQLISKPDGEAADSGSKGSPTVSVAASAASVDSRQRRGSLTSDSGRMVYECELGTGFRGTLEEVKDHEARILKMREDTKKELAMARNPRPTFSSGSSAAPGSAATALVSASDTRYAPRATSSRPVASPVLASPTGLPPMSRAGPYSTYSSSSRYPEEDLYGGTRSSSFALGDVSVRSADLSFSDSTHSAASSRADALASKAAARKQRWAAAATTSRAPRREPGAAPLSEGEPPTAYKPGRRSVAGTTSHPATMSDLGAEDRD